MMLWYLMGGWGVALLIHLWETRDLDSAEYFED